MQYKNRMLVILLIALTAGCKKTHITTTPLASINIVNAAVNVPGIKVNFMNLPGQYASIPTISYGGNKTYSVLANLTVPVAIVTTSDTLHPIYSGNLQLTGTGIYSLYLAGQSTAVDTILVRETIPVHTDSSCGVRFINLSYNSSPITITLSATPTVVEFSNLAYKQASTFKTYPALAGNTSYAFQVRDAGTNTILSTYTLSTPRFFNCTLVWKGMVGGTGANAPGIQRVNNY